MQYTIYHNSRCSKSRQTLQLLQDNGIEPTVIEYLKTPLKKSELQDLCKQLGKRPKEVLRTKEDDFKNLNLDLENDDKVIEAIIKFPKILERPIVSTGKKAVLGRPPEQVLELI